MRENVCLPHDWIRSSPGQVRVRSPATTKRHQTPTCRSNDEILSPHALQDATPGLLYEPHTANMVIRLYRRVWHRRRLVVPGETLNREGLQNLPRARDYRDTASVPGGNAGFPYVPSTTEQPRAIDAIPRVVPIGTVSDSLATLSVPPAAMPPKIQCELSFAIYESHRRILARVDFYRSTMG